jgi:hypothetical protein
MASIFDDIEVNGVFKKLTKREITERMHKLVPKAFRTLESNLYSDDDKVAVQAALGILDRCGYGPQSKITVEESTEDLSNLTNEELRERAIAIAAQINVNPSDSGDSVH